MKKTIHHYTEMEKCCEICNKPFLFFWHEKEEKNGFSETMWQDKYHKKCIEEKTGKKCKTLQEINEERKNER
jgi:hypothetical protein